MEMEKELENLRKQQEEHQNKQGEVNNQTQKALDSLNNSLMQEQEKLKEIQTSIESLPEPENATKLIEIVKLNQQSVSALSSLVQTVEQNTDNRMEQIQQTLDELNQTLDVTQGQLGKLDEAVQNLGEITAGILALNEDLQTQADQK